MRRVMAVVIATVGGLALLLTFKTSPSGVKRVAITPIGQQPAATAPPTNGSTAPGATTPETSPPTSPTQGSAPTTGTSGAAKSYDGQVVSNQYGDVQVRVVLQGGRIVDVQALTLPTDRRRSAEISQYAEPLLRQEVLQAQSAQIDLVSGASYTSDSYAQSLQSALDQAHA